MLRRRQVLGAAAAMSLLAGGVWIMTGSKRFSSLVEAQRAVADLANGHLRGAGAWNLAQVMNHAAQSIEYSIDGFPALKPALFRASVGRLAFAVFEVRGEMSHPLDQPIPGAPALAIDAPLAPAVQRLLAAMQRFDEHGGPLQPHFAYGVLDKAAYTRAHLMHLANHWAEFAPA
jgi:hypothetical protein